MPALLVCLLFTQSTATYAAGRSIGAKGVALKDPEALQPFFKSLDGLALGDAKENVSVVVFGNSLISGDNIVDVVRKRLQAKFGDGGRGLLFAERLKGGNHRRAGTSVNGGWAPFQLAMGPRGFDHFGVSGIFHETTREATTEWKADGAVRAELFWLDHPEAPVLDLRVDGERLALIVPERASPTAKSVSVALPAGASVVSLHAAGPHAISFGLALERSGGVTLDNYGLPAAEAAKFLSADAVSFAEQLKARHPALVVFMLGGNEGRRLTWGDAPPRKASQSPIRRDLTRLIERSTQAAPGSACLVVGPIDSVYGDDAEDPSQRFETEPHVPDVVAIERQVAKAQGCAFFDLFAAMGGKGSLGRFHARGWLHEDLVHPQGRGLDVLGELIARGILDAYAARSPRAALH